MSRCRAALPSHLRVRLPARALPPGRAGASTGFASSSTRITSPSGRPVRAATSSATAPAPCRRTGAAARACVPARSCRRSSSAWRAARPRAYCSPMARACSENARRLRHHGIDRAPEVRALVDEEQQHQQRQLQHRGRQPAALHAGQRAGRHQAGQLARQLDAPAARAQQLDHQARVVADQQRRVGEQAIVGEHDRAAAAFVRALERVRRSCRAPGSRWGRRRPARSSALAATITWWPPGTDAARRGRRLPCSSGTCSLSGAGASVDIGGGAACFDVGGGRRRVADDLDADPLGQLALAARDDQRPALRRPVADRRPVFLLDGGGGQQHQLRARYCPAWSAAPGARAPRTRSAAAGRRRRRVPTANGPSWSRSSAAAGEQRAQARRAASSGSAGRHAARRAATARRSAPSGSWPPSARSPPNCTAFDGARPPPACAAAAPAACVRRRARGRRWCGAARRARRRCPRACAAARRTRRRSRAGSRRPRRRRARWSAGARRRSRSGARRRRRRDRRAASGSSRGRVRDRSGPARSRAGRSGR